MSDDDGMRPLRSWPSWMLLSIVKFRRRRTMWAEAYFELVERGKDAAHKYAGEHGSAWVVHTPPGIH